LPRVDHARNPHVPKQLGGLGVPEIRISSQGQADENVFKYFNVAVTFASPRPPNTFGDENDRRRTGELPKHFVVVIELVPRKDFLAKGLACGHADVPSATPHDKNVTTDRARELGVAFFSLHLRPESLLIRNYAAVTAFNWKRPIDIKVHFPSPSPTSI
jgi:hypothetical protein